MIDFRTKNAVFLAIPESPSGTQGSPTVGSNAIRVRDQIQYSPNFDNIPTNYVQESVSASAPIIGGGMVGMSVGVHMTGAATAGTAPDYGPLLRGGAMQETLTAADVAGTAQAGAAGSITLAAAGTSAVNDAYKGMVIETTGGTGGTPVQRRVIKAYNGTTKVATIYPNWTVTVDVTTTYAIRKNARYLPISVAQESLTCWAYQRNSASGGLARLRKLIAGMDGWSLGIKPRGLATLDFKLQGQLPSNPADVADPGAATYTGQEACPYLNAQTYLGGSAVKFNSFSLDSGNGIKMFDDPSQLYGYDTSEITTRLMTGKITPPLSLVASRDSFSDWLASSSKDLWLCWGAVGKGISIYLPAIRYTGNQPGDTDGFQTEDLPFQATGLDGEAYISVF
jgi:hypothetical protein